MEVTRPLRYNSSSLGSAPAPKVRPTIRLVRVAFGMDVGRQAGNDWDRTTSAAQAVLRKTALFAPNLTVGNTRLADGHESLNYDRLPQLGECSRTTALSRSTFVPAAWIVNGPRGLRGREQHPTSQKLTN